jgi:hypothetical protein
MKRTPYKHQHLEPALLCRSGYAKAMQADINTSTL